MTTGQLNSRTNLILTGSIAGSLAIFAAFIIGEIHVSMEVNAVATLPEAIGILVEAASLPVAANAALHWLKRRSHRAFDRMQSEWNARHDPEADSAGDDA